MTWINIIFNTLSIILGTSGIFALILNYRKTRSDINQTDINTIKSQYGLIKELRKDVDDCEKRSDEQDVVIEKQGHEIRELKTIVSEQDMTIQRLESTVKNQLARSKRNEEMILKLQEK